MSSPSGPILAVAGDGALAAVLETVLTPAGHERIEAVAPEHALEAVASQQPRLVVIDLELPDADGVDMLATLAPLR